MTGLTSSLHLFVDAWTPHFVRKHCFIATIPGWPSCANSSTWQRSCFGITILVPRRTSFPIALNSPRRGKNSWNSKACHYPFKRDSRTLFRSGSCTDALSIWRVVRATILGRPTSHILRSGLCVLTVALHTGDVTRNQQYSKDLEYISL